jgi:hypothetical protein
MPMLREDALYLGDNGRCFCGKERHAGTTAYFTGRDLSGQTAYEVTELDRREARRMRIPLACEGCRQDSKRRAVGQ